MVTSLTFAFLALLTDDARALTATYCFKYTTGFSDALTTTSGTR